MDKVCKFLFTPYIMNTYNNITIKKSLSILYYYYYYYYHHHHYY